VLLLVVLEVSADTEYRYSVKVWWFERACNQNDRGRKGRREIYSRLQKPLSIVPC